MLDFDFLNQYPELESFSFKDDIMIVDYLHQNPNDILAIHVPTFTLINIKKVIINNIHLRAKAFLEMKKLQLLLTESKIHYPVPKKAKVSVDALELIIFFMNIVSVVMFIVIGYLSIIYHLHSFVVMYITIANILNLCTLSTINSIFQFIIDTNTDTITIQKIHNHELIHLTKHIYCFYDVIDPEILFSFEYNNGGTLQEIIDKNAKLTNEDMMIISYSLVQSLKILHAKEIAHGNIKPCNIGFSFDGLVKLLCVTTIFNETININSCPEDIYYLGLMLFEVIQGKPDKISMTPMIPQKFRHRGSNLFLDFIISCLTIDPKHRPCCSELLCHEFLTPVNNMTTNIPKMKNLNLKYFTEADINSIIQKILEWNLNHNDEENPSKYFNSIKRKYYFISSSDFMKTLHDNDSVLGEYIEPFLPNCHTNKLEWLSIQMRCDSLSIKNSFDDNIDQLNNIAEEVRRSYYLSDKYSNVMIPQLVCEKLHQEVIERFIESNRLDNRFPIKRVDSEYNRWTNCDNYQQNVFSNDNFTRRYQGGLYCKIPSTIKRKYVDAIAGLELCPLHRVESLSIPLSDLCKEDKEIDEKDIIVNPDTFASILEDDAITDRREFSTLIHQLRHSNDCNSPETKEFIPSCESLYF